jgi:hypothetical protein
MLDTEKRIFLWKGPDWPRDWKFESDLVDEIEMCCEGNVQNCPEIRPVESHAARFNALERMTGTNRDGIW